MWARLGKRRVLPTSKKMVFKEEDMSLLYSHIVLGRPWSSEIAQPPIVAGSFDSGEPATNGVKDDDRRDPESVDRAKAVSKVWWEHIRWTAHGWHGIENEVRCG